MILPIYLEPQPILRNKTKLVEPSEIGSGKFKQLLADMIVTMRQADGLGLAAPQVGIGLRFTVIEPKIIDKKHKEALVLINPRLIRKSFKKALMEEGCLSIPGVYGYVKRPAGITVKYLDQTNKEQKLKAEGLLAVVIQHEIDHLDGILFTDKVKKYTENNRIKPKYLHIT